MQKIRFHFLDTEPHLRNRTRLKEFIYKQLQRNGKETEAINYIFCTDAYLLTLNQSYLRHDTYTDIITFELSESRAALVADIYISVERVRENATHFGISFTQELLRVIFHGALHLAGYKDKTKSEKENMRRQESAWLRLYNVPRENRRVKD